MQRIAFPRLYEPPAESADPVPVQVRVMYHGRRSQFGPVTVHCVAQEREVVSECDWRGEEAVTLARTLLYDLLIDQCTRECCEAFAGEILENLSADSWELTVEEIHGWYLRWSGRQEEARWRYPPESDLDEELPGPDDDARMLELVERLSERDGAEESTAENG